MSRASLQRREDISHHVRSFAVPESRNRSMILVARSRRGRVTPRTYFLSNSRYSADESSPFNDFPLFLAAHTTRVPLPPPPVSACPPVAILILDPSRPSSFPLPRAHQSAAVVIAVVVVVVVASSYSRQSHRAHVPRNRTVFSSGICGPAHNEVPPPLPYPPYSSLRRFPVSTIEDPPFGDSDRKVGASRTPFLHSCLVYSLRRAEKCRLDFRPVVAARSKNRETANRG